MEVYILDSLYRRSQVVDRFESLIWTERWADIGDFELLLASNPGNRSLFNPDTALAMNLSKRVMIVETIEDSTDDDGRKRIKVKGRSIEKILDDRAVRSTKKNSKDLPTISIVGNPVGIAYGFFQDVCVYGKADANDIIPNVSLGTSYPAENIPPINPLITWDQDPTDSILKAYTDMAPIYKFGFRLYRDGDNGQLFFNIYTGNDRTTTQTVLPPVVFTPELDSLQNTTELLSIEKAKNVAYVTSDQGFEVVYAPDADMNMISGFNRRVLSVKADTLALPNDANGNPVTPTAAQISTYLQQKGKDELAKNRTLRAFDGEINQRSPYRYGVHYELGDLVEMRNSDGIGNQMRVSEQIFVHDGEGERSYPTLAIDSYISPGQWNSWLGFKLWSDMGTTDYWSTQP
jgi:hypothetical protein